MKILKTKIKNVDKIVHVADIHIRPYKRHEEFEKVFRTLYDSIIKQTTENSLIVLAGDIVHAKTEMTPELIMILSSLFSKLSSICSVLLIPGNHDANLSNLSRLDALTPIVNNLKLDNFHYIKTGGLYNFANLTFCHMSIFDDNSEYIKADSFDASFKIALFHGIVNDATNDFNFKFKSNRMNMKIFEGYDIVMLGDIHKHQFLSPTAAYAGSLIQNNHGESLEKGYLLWDIETKTSEFIKIKNEYGYCTIEIKGNKIPEIKNVPEKCRLRLKVYDLNNDETNKILNEIRQKYKPVELTVNRINSAYSINKNIQNVDIHNLKDIEYQNDLIKKYLIENYNLDKDSIDKIYKINSDLNNKIEIDEFIKDVKWKPISFKWSNMFSYGEDNFVDFVNLKGIIGLFGPNATGKSAFVDAISFCLYDKASKDFLPINIMNTRKDFFECELQFEILDRKCFINRTVKRTKKGDSVYRVNFWSIDANGKKQSLNGENRWGTNKQINNIIGTFEDFILTTFSMQEKNANFINIGHARRKDLIIQFMGLGIFDKLGDCAKEELKDIKSIIKDLQKEDWDSKKDEFNDSMTEEQKEYTILENKCSELSSRKTYLEDKINSLKQKIIDIETKNTNIYSLNEKLHNVDETLIEEKKESKSLADEVNGAQLEISETREKMMHYFNMNVEKLYDEYVEIKENSYKINLEHFKLETILKGKREKVDKLKEVEYDPNCKFCMNNVLVKDAIKTKSGIVEDEKKLSELNEKIKTLDSIVSSKSHIEVDYEKYKNIVAELSELQQDATELNNKLEKKNLYIISLEKELNEIKNDIQEYEKSKEIIENNNKLGKEIEELQLNRIHTEEDLNDENKRKLHSYGKIQVFESQIELCKQSKDKLEKNIVLSEHYSYYLECVKRDGIPYRIITNIIPPLETEINNILNQIVDFTISVIPDDKNINMFIDYDKDRIWPLELASGMEKFISSIALRVALTNISNLPRPNFLIIDEGWGTLDSDNLNSVSMLLDYLRTQFDFAIIISHIDSIKEVADSLIEITRKNNFSYITMK